MELGLSRAVQLASSSLAGRELVAAELVFDLSQTGSSYLDMSIARTWSQTGSQSQLVCEQLASWSATC